MISKNFYLIALFLIGITLVVIMPSRDYVTELEVIVAGCG